MEDLQDLVKKKKGFLGAGVLGAGAVLGAAAQKVVQDTGPDENRFEETDKALLAWKEKGLIRGNDVEALTWYFTQGNADRAMTWYLTQGNADRSEVKVEHPLGGLVFRAHLYYKQWQQKQQLDFEWEKLALWEQELARAAQERKEQQEKLALWQQELALRQQERKEEEEKLEFLKWQFAFQKEKEEFEKLKARTASQPLVFYGSHESFGREYQEVLTQPDIVNWENIKKKVVAIHKDVDFSRLEAILHRTVFTYNPVEVYGNDVTLKDVVGKKFFACNEEDEEDEKDKLKHYVAFTLMVTALLSSIMAAYGKEDQRFASIVLKEHEIVQKRNGSEKNQILVRIPDGFVREVDPTKPPKLELNIEMKSYKRKAEKLLEQGQKKKRTGAGHEDEDETGDVSCFLSNDHQLIPKAEIMTGVGQVAEVHISTRGKGLSVESGLVSNGVHVMVVRTVPTDSEPKQRSGLLRISGDKNTQRGDPLLLDYTSHGVDVLLKELVLSLVRAELLPESVLRHGKGGEGGDSVVGVEPAEFVVDGDSAKPLACI